MISILFITALLMEIISSYVSVVGLGALFSGDVVILAMAVILDVAKITTVSFLYQYWVKIHRLMKIYLFSAVLILMTITSVGAFGYLSAAFQKAVLPTMEIQLKVDSFKREREQLNIERTQLLEQRVMIDKQVAQLSGENVKGRQALIRSFKPESNRISARLTDVTTRLDKLSQDVLQVESESIDKQVHVGPITYVAKAFNISVEEASKWIILTIIIVFDPLAVMLIVSGNFLVKLRKEAPKDVDQIKTEPPTRWARPKYGGKYGDFHKPVGSDLYKATIEELEQNNELEAQNGTDGEPVPKREPITAAADEDRYDVDPLAKLDPIEPYDEPNLVDSEVYELVIERGKTLDFDEFNRLIDALEVQNIYDYRLDHGEAPFDMEPDEPEVDELEPELPVEPVLLPPSELADLKINLLGSLLREGVVTHSTKRYMYDS